MKKKRHDKTRHMNIIKASLEECRYHLTQAKDLGYGDTSLLTSQLEAVSNMLEAFTSSILSSEQSPHTYRAPISKKVCQ